MIEEIKEKSCSEKREEIILNMLKKKLDVSLISEVTGLSKKEIKRLTNGRKLPSTEDTLEDTFDVRDNIKKDGRYKKRWSVGRTRGNYFKYVGREVGYFCYFNSYRCI